MALAVSATVSKSILCLSGCICFCSVVCSCDLSALEDALMDPRANDFQCVQALIVRIRLMTSSNLLHVRAETWNNILNKTTILRIIKIYLFPYLCIFNLPLIFSHSMICLFWNNFVKCRTTNVSKLIICLTHLFPYNSYIIFSQSFIYKTVYHINIVLFILILS